MGSKSLDFFATKADCETVIQAVESQESLKYALCGLFASPTTTIVYSGVDIPHLSMPVTGNAISGDRYSVIATNEEIKAREIPQRKGGVLYAIDQLENPTSITFQPGGVFENRWLISGTLGTASNHPLSLKLHNLFVREIQKKFTRIKYAWLGREALQFFDSGMCLSSNADMLPEYCLTR